MIRIIGAKRLIALSVMLAINAVLVVTTYVYLMPERQVTDRDLRLTQSEISQKRTETDRLRNEYEQIQSQKGRFESLEASGFFSNQNRLVARRRIEDIQRRSGVLSTSYNIGAGQMVVNENAREAGHVVLQSPIRMEVTAMDDVDIYHFIYWIENAFPGHVTIQRLTMQRKQDINEAALRRIGTGQETVMIEAGVNVLWRTMISEEIVRGQSRTLPEWY